MSLPSPISPCGVTSPRLSSHGQEGGASETTVVEPGRGDPHVGRRGGCTAGLSLYSPRFFLWPHRERLGAGDVALAHLTGRTGEPPTYPTPLLPHPARLARCGVIQAVIPILGVQKKVHSYHH